MSQLFKFSSCPNPIRNLDHFCAGCIFYDQCNLKVKKQQFVEIPSEKPFPKSKLVRKKRKKIKKEIKGKRRSDMPNWCENQLTVSGCYKNLEKFKKAFMGTIAKWPINERVEKLSEREIEKIKREYETPRYCFNALVPVPEDILEWIFKCRLSMVY